MEGDTPLPAPAAALYKHCFSNLAALVVSGIIRQEPVEQEKPSRGDSAHEHFSSSLFYTGCEQCSGKQASANVAAAHSQRGRRGGRC